ncbi:CACNG6 [Mytilus coruscus]|uniref:CACNG6 n=1 Tax=Mytilus coruscus TaxID=42192 RepID=A0A6J8D481_MYTCO|nr:CACNG6 [Mytilus coruscus]
MAIFGDAKPITMAGFIVGIVSFVLQLIGFATPYWRYAKRGSVALHYGLWQTCLPTCVKFDCGVFGCTSALKGTQALETLAFIILLAAVVLVAVQLFMMKDKDILKKAGAVCCIVAGVFALIGVIVFATQNGIEKSNLHFSFAFCIIAAVGGIVAGVLLVIG